MTENKLDVTTEQLIMLLDELETNPEMSRERILRATKNIYDLKWNLLAARLNAVPNGAKRTVPRWKNVLSNWKMNIKTQAGENMENSESLDEMGQRLLQVIQNEEGLHSNAEIENENVFRRQELRRSNRRRSRNSESFANQRRQSLQTIFHNNVDRNSTPEKRIMEMQLERLQQLSVQLEGHIQDVQNRIQMIRDLWYHECAYD